MAITPLPTLDRTSTTFRTDVDTFFGSQLPAFATEANALQTDVNAKQVTASSAATTATTKAGEALASANAADASMDAALVAQTAAEAALDSFDDRYLGAKAAAPALDNDGGALLTGAMYFDTVENELRIYNGTIWNIVAADATLLVAKTANTGSLIGPAGTTAQRDAVPAVGYQRFNTTLNSPEVWNGTEWAPMGGGATGAPGNYVFVENDQTVTGDYTLTAGKNAGSFGPIQINTGVTVTIPVGATWTVV